MTKAGGIPAHPAVPPERSGHRSLGKSAQSREDAGAGLGFPQHLTSLEGDDGHSGKAAVGKSRGQEGAAHLRSAVVDRNAADGAARSGRGEGAKRAHGSVSDFVAELKRMLAGELEPSSRSEASGDTAVGPVEQSANLSSDVFQNVITLMPQTTARSVAAPAAGAGARVAQSEAAAGGKVLPLPLGFRQVVTNGPGRPDTMTTSDDEVPPMPGRDLSDAIAEPPSRDVQTRVRAALPEADKDADVGLARNAAKSDVKVTTVRQETHFAPPMKSTPAMQVADAVASGLADLEAQQAPRTTSEQAVTKPVSTAPLRVLQVQLQPAELGIVTISLSLKADALELHIDAMRADTADLLRRDREVLSDLLRQTGYDVDTVSVRVADPDAGILTGGQTTTHNQGQPQSVSAPGQLQGGWSMPDDRSRGARHQAGHGQDSGSSRSDSTGVDRSTPEAPAGLGVYI